MTYFVNLVMYAEESKSALRLTRVMDKWAEGEFAREKLQHELVRYYRRTKCARHFGYPFPGWADGAVVDLSEDVDSVFDWAWRIISSGVNEQRSELKQITCELLNVVKDVVGNPFRPVTFDPRWRTSDVVGLAKAIYDDKAFERMPILADALMDAGCEDEVIIAHCRGDGPHVRGCWVVDLVLGKE
jgi:hypothetical protein